MNINWKQIGTTAAIAGVMAVPIYGSGNQLNTLAGRYSAPLAMAVGTAISSAATQLIVEKFDPILQYDMNQSPLVAVSDLLLYNGAVTGGINAAMYMNDRPGAAAAIGTSSQILGQLAATSLFDRK